jgi:hypothetical protein
LDKIKEICLERNESEENILLLKINQFEAKFLYKNKFYEKCAFLLEKTEKLIHEMYQVNKGLIKYFLAQIYYK